MNPSRVCLFVTMAALALCAAATHAADRELILEGALGEGRDMHLYVRFDDAGKATAAFGFARRFNRMPHNVDASGLLDERGMISGAARITIPSDGYVPKGGTALTVDVNIIKPGPTREEPLMFTARFGQQTTRGHVNVRTMPAPREGDTIKLHLQCENAINFTRRKGGSRRIGMMLTAHDGKVAIARLIPRGSITDVAMTGKVTWHQLTLDERGRLTGTLNGTRLPNGKKDKPEHYTWQFEGQVIGDRAIGTFQTTTGGKTHAGGAFIADVTTGTPDPADALYKITMHGAAPDQRVANIYLATAKGKVLHGFATTPNFNNSIHTIDITGLTLKGDRLRGKLGLTIIPDIWIPKDGKPIACSYDIDARITLGELVGQHTGNFGKQDMKGAIEGGLTPKPRIKQISKLTLKYENCGFGRGFISMDYEDGKFVKGRVWNNHSNLEGTVRDVKLKLENERLTGTFTVTVAKGGVKAGTYTCTANGVMVGQLGAGMGVTTYQKDGREKESSFWVAISGE